MKPKITKKQFRQLIVGKIIDHIPISELFKPEHENEIKRAQIIAAEIIQFSEQYNLFNPEI